MNSLKEIFSSPFLTQTEIEKKYLNLINIDSGKELSNLKNEELHEILLSALLSKNINSLHALKTLNFNFYELKENSDLYYFTIEKINESDPEKVKIVSKKTEEVNNWHHIYQFLLDNNIKPELPMIDNYSTFNDENNITFLEDLIWRNQFEKLNFFIKNGYQFDIIIEGIPYIMKNAFVNLDIEKIENLHKLNVKINKESIESLSNISVTNEQDELYKIKEIVLFLYEENLLSDNKLLVAKSLLSNEMLSMDFIKDLFNIINPDLSNLNVEKNNKIYKNLASNNFEIFNMCKEFGLQNKNIDIFLLLKNSISENTNKDNKIFLATNKKDLLEEDLNKLIDFVKDNNNEILDELLKYKKNKSKEDYDNILSTAEYSLSNDIQSLKELIFIMDKYFPDYFSELIENKNAKIYNYGQISYSSAGIALLIIPEISKKYLKNEKDIYKNLKVACELIERNPNAINFSVFEKNITDLEINPEIKLIIMNKLLKNVETFEHYDLIDKSFLNIKRMEEKKLLEEKFTNNIKKERKIKRI